jgi:hypothetical protein
MSERRARRAAVGGVALVAAWLLAPERACASFLDGFRDPDDGQIDLGVASRSQGTTPAWTTRTATTITPYLQIGGAWR